MELSNATAHELVVNPKNSEVSMLIKHQGNTPDVHPSAYIAPTATVCGDVKIGPNCRVMHGVSIIAEGGRITIGKHCTIFENAVIRCNTKHSSSIGDFCLIGPNAPVVGCTIEEVPQDSRHRPLDCRALVRDLVHRGIARVLALVRLQVLLRSEVSATRTLLFTLVEIVRAPHLGA